MGVFALRGASHVRAKPCRALAACLRPHTGVVMDVSDGITYTVPTSKMRSMAPGALDANRCNLTAFK